MGEPSGTYGRLLKIDYLAAIKHYLDYLPPKSIIPGEWLLVGSVERCGRPSSLGGNLCPLHRGRIPAGKPQSVQCVKCNRGTKNHNRLCTRCGGYGIYDRLKRVETKARKKLRECNERVGRCKVYMV